MQNNDVTESVEQDKTTKQKRRYNVGNERLGINNFCNKTVWTMTNFKTL
jgi:hypothetical protein